LEKITEYLSQFME